MSLCCSRCKQVIEGESCELTITDGELWSRHSRHLHLCERCGGLLADWLKVVELDEALAVQTAKIFVDSSEMHESCPLAS